MSEALQVEAPLVPVEILENIIYQPDDALTDCAYYATANLCVRLGMPAPPIWRMKALWKPHDWRDGVTTPEALAILCELNVPGLCAIGFIPHGLTARDVIPPLLEAGWQLLLGIAWVTELKQEGADLMGEPTLAGMKTWVAHSVIPYGYDEDGLDVIVGWHGMPVHKIKWSTMPSLDWKKLQNQQYGISREFVMVMPHRKGEGNGHSPRG